MAADYNTCMKIESVGRIAGVFACLAMLSGRVSAQGEDGLAAAFGSMNTALLAVAQLKTAAQVPSERTPEELAASYAQEFRSGWAKVIPIALAEGVRSPLPNSSQIVYELQRTDVDAAGEGNYYYVNVTGFNAADGTFILTKALFWRELRRPKHSPTEGWAVNAYIFTTDSTAVLTKILFRDYFQFPDGRIEVKREDDHSNDGMGLVFYSSAVGKFKKFFPTR